MRSTIKSAWSQCHLEHFPFTQADLAPIDVEEAFRLSTREPWFRHYLAKIVFNIVESWSDSE